MQIPSKKLLVPIALAISLALVLVIKLPAKASIFSNKGVIEAGEVIDDDLFISHDTVTMDGTVNGDLFISSNNITVNGTVNGNLIITGARVEVKGTINGSLVFAGQSMLVDGPVSGSIYAAGAAIHLGPNAHVKRNIYSAGYHLEIAEGAQVERDVRFVGAQALLYGSVGQDAVIEADALEIAGNIGRDVYAKIGDPREDPFPTQSLPFFQYPNAPQTVPYGLRVSESAQIGGKIKYSSVIEQTSAIKATPELGVEFTLAKKTTPGQKDKVDPAQALVLWVIGRVRLIATLAVLSILMVWLLPGFLPRISDQAGAAPLRATGWGVVVLAGGFTLAFVSAIAIVMIGILIGIVSLGGLAQAVFGLGFSSLGLAFALFMFVIQYGSKLIVSHLGGKWLLKRLSPAYAEHRFWPLILGILIYVPLNGIPVLGWLIGLVTTLIGLGAIWLLYREWRGSQVAPQA